MRPIGTSWQGARRFFVSLRNDNAEVMKKQRRGRFSCPRLCFMGKRIYLNLCYYLYLNKGTLRQVLHRNAATRGLFGEISSVHLVECCEIRDVSEEAGGFNRLFIACARRREYLAEIFHNLLCLRGDVGDLDASRFRVNGNLPRGENETARDDCLRVWTYCGGSFIRRYNFSHFTKPNLPFFVLEKLFLPFIFISVKRA